MKCSFAWRLFATFALGSTLATHGQQKRIYIAPDDHTDYLWTADEKTYEKVMLDMTGYYLDLVDKTMDRPSNEQARWNFDGSLWMQVLERNKDQKQIDRVISRLRDGHFSMPLNYAVSTYGGMPTEAVLRGMYYSGEVERRYGLRFPMAVAMEDQTLPRGLSSLFAGAGAKYSWRGVCACATKMKPAIIETRPHDIYWWKGPDDSRILLKWYSIYTGGPHIGTYLEARETTKNIEFVDNSPVFRKAYPYNVIGLFGEGGDDLQTSNENFLDAARKLSTPQREVIVSNEEDFFRDFEQQYGSILPEVKVSYGNEWDMYSASMAELSASVRRSTERLRAAEAMATLVSFKQPDFYDRRVDARRDAWAGMGLYWEHDWTADSKILPRDARRDWQRRTALKITSYVDSLASDASVALGAQIETHGSRPRYFVFNPLNWRRSDAADLPYKGSEKVHLVDISTGSTVPSQFADEVDEHGIVRRVLRIWASDIPSVGYKTFEVVPGAVDSTASILRTGLDTLENDTYRIQLDGSGAFASIVAKKLGGREMVSRINGRSFNDWGTGFDLNDRSAGKLEIVNAGPVSATLRVTIASPLPRTVEVTLYREGDRIDIRNDVRADFRDLETWAFSMNFASPDVHHEEVGAINHARLAPEGDYAATYSRLDWLTLNHFASMSGADGVGVTLSNEDAAFMKLGQTEMIGGVSQFDAVTPQITILAGGQVDGSSLGIADQGGDKYLLQRFAVQVYKNYSPAASMRFSLEHQNPLVTAAVTGGRGFPENQFSLLSTSDPDLLLWALKPSEEGIAKGVAARFWNMSEKPKEFAVQMNGGLKRAWALTHLETEIGPASIVGSSLRAKAAQWQILTFRLLPANATGDSGR